MNNLDQSYILGRSLQIINGDLNISEGDFAQVLDRNNFLQGLQMMIETPLGTDIFNVNYGFELMNCISQPQSIRMIKELIRLNIVKSLSLDDRLREIKEVVFNDEPRYFELNPQAYPETMHDARKNSRQWEAIVVLNAISGEEIILKLKGLGL